MIPYRYGIGPASLVHVHTHNFGETLQVHIITIQCESMGTDNGDCDRFFGDNNSESRIMERE